MRRIGGYLGEGIDGKAIGKDGFFPAQLQKRLCGVLEQLVLYPA
jgi:hypothetical protein